MIMRFHMPNSTLTDHVALSIDLYQFMKKRQAFASQMNILKDAEKERIDIANEETKQVRLIHETQNRKGTTAGNQKGCNGQGQKTSTGA